MKNYHAFWIGYTMAVLAGYLDHGALGAFCALVFYVAVCMLLCAIIPKTTSPDDKFKLN